MRLPGEGWALRKQDNGLNEIRRTRSRRWRFRKKDDGSGRKMALQIAG
jgi:hypothetical protein